VGQYDVSHKEIICNTFMSHTTGYQYVSEMVMLTAVLMKLKLNPNSRLALVCLYYACLHDVKAHNEQDILTFSPLCKITYSLYIRHISYHTLDTAICTRLHYLLHFGTYFTSPLPCVATSHHTESIYLNESCNPLSVQLQ